MPSRKRANISFNTSPHNSHITAPEPSSNLTHTPPIHHSHSAYPSSSALRTVEIFPSLISADLLNLQAWLTLLDPHCAGYHLDIMDNQFVPNLTWGPAFINAIARHAKRMIWVHIMVNTPARLIDALELPEESIVTIHLEACPDLANMIQQIKNKKWRPSLAIKPKTPISALAPYLELVDHVLVMSVEPGFSGQKFLPETEQKLDQLIALLRDKKNYTIALDGGITQENIARLVSKGVTQFAVAQAIFGQPDPVRALQNLESIATLV